MKKWLLLLACLPVVACQNQKQVEQPLSKKDLPAVDTADLTNNFYDNAATYPLKTLPLEVTGEIENPGVVDFSGLPLHSVIVKEAVLKNEGNQFIGAYRYDGYSLLDILNHHGLEKKNQDEFPPIIDLFVEIENEKGEKAVFSWGEIFYPNQLHEIIIATHVMRIVPSKTKELWELPEHSKLVVRSDLITARNLDKPVKIKVVSASRKFPVEKGMSPMYAGKIDVYHQGNKTMSISDPPRNVPEVTCETIFYGRGRGIHSTTPFTGQMLKEILVGQIPFNSKNLRMSYLIVAAKDGYRGVFSYSEIFNRNDQSEVLLVDYPEGEDGGKFRLFPACDFFSDRAIKSVSSIWFEKINN